jgi:hypothetical protein
MALFLCPSCKEQTVKVLRPLWYMTSDDFIAVANICFLHIPTPSAARVLKMYTMKNRKQL